MLHLCFLPPRPLNPPRQALRVGHAVAADAGGAAGRANGQRADRMPAPAPWPQPRRRKPVRVRSEGGGPAPGAEYGI